MPMSAELISRFQLTPPHGRRQDPASCQDQEIHFNSRLRTGGDAKMSATSQSLPNFNSRLRTGGDTFACRCEIYPIISTHASAREATLPPNIVAVEVNDFNSRLRTGGDIRLHFFVPAARYFNSRLRTGGDNPQQQHTINGNDFNSRLRTGGDRLWSLT